MLVWNDPCIDLCMMILWNRKTFCVIGHLCGESNCNTSHHWISLTKCQWCGALMFSVVLACLTVDQTVELMVIWDAMMFMRRHCSSVITFICMSVCLSVCVALSMSLSICLSSDLSLYPSACPFVHLSVGCRICLSVCPSVCLSMSVCPSICLSIDLSVCLSLFIHLLVCVCWSVVLSVHPSVSVCLFVCVYLSVHLSVSPSICQSVHLSVCVRLSICPSAPIMDGFWSSKSHLLWWPGDTYTGVIIKDVRLSQFFYAYAFRHWRHYVSGFASVSPSVYLSVHLSVRLTLHFPGVWSIICPSIHASLWRGLWAFSGEHI